MTTTTDLLRRAAERTRNHASWIDDMGRRAEVLADTASLLALADQMESLQRDAERYRWLRDGNATERGEPWAITRYAPGDERNRDGGTCSLAGDELDAAIDAAMTGA